MVRATPTVITYFWKNLECELCRTSYPYATRSLDGRLLLPIIEYERPPPKADGTMRSFLVLESISTNTSKVIHVIDMDYPLGSNGCLYIGRGHEAHIRVTDISVSRLHARLIRSSEGLFFFGDNGSKFGSLALVRTPLELQANSRTQL